MLVIEIPQLTQQEKFTFEVYVQFVVCVCLTHSKALLARFYRYQDILFLVDLILIILSYILTLVVYYLKIFIVNVNVIQGWSSISSIFLNYNNVCFFQLYKLFQCIIF
ncbi:uncharacterized protein RJT21DRAFT_113526 [Scheffersomyces amazonensis]|uniref:uncharacterized protein n=1 Tax=Scheffersomyces amazonensis TaxID=1078765 RepID=UPI00315D9072